MNLATLRTSLSSIIIQLAHEELTNPVLMTVNPVALRKAKIVYNFGLSECKRVKLMLWTTVPSLATDPMVSISQCCKEIYEFDQGRVIHRFNCSQAKLCHACQNIYKIHTILLLLCLQLKI